MEILNLKMVNLPFIRGRRFYRAIPRFLNWLFNCPFPRIRAIFALNPRTFFSIGPSRNCAIRSLYSGFCSRFTGC